MAEQRTTARPKAKPLRPIDAKLRARIEAAVEKLIAALYASEDTDTDTAADDAPIDDDEREPSLGSFDAMVGQNAAWKVPDNSCSWWDTDREVEDEHDEDGGDREPDVDDEDGGDNEPDVDDEPSLGSFDRMMDQTKSHKIRELCIVEDGEIGPRRPPKPEPSICNVTTLDGSPFKPESECELVRLSGGRWVPYRIR